MAKRATVNADGQLQLLVGPESQPSDETVKLALKLFRLTKKILRLCIDIYALDNRLEGLPPKSERIVIASSSILAMFCTGDAGNWRDCLSAVENIANQLNLFPQNVKVNLDDYKKDDEEGDEEDDDIDPLELDATLDKLQDLHARISAGTWQQGAEA